MLSSKHIPMILVIIVILHIILSWNQFSYHLFLFDQDDLTLVFVAFSLASTQSSKRGVAATKRRRDEVSRQNGEMREGLTNSMECLEEN